MKSCERMWMRASTVSPPVRDMTQVSPAMNFHEARYPTSIRHSYARVAGGPYGKGSDRSDFRLILSDLNRHAAEY